MSTDRFAFASEHLTASFNAQSIGARVESGYRFATLFGGLTPYAAVQAQNFRTPSYSETNVNGGGSGRHNGAAYALICVRVTSAAPGMSCERGCDRYSPARAAPRSPRGSASPSPPLRRSG